MNTLRVSPWVAASLASGLLLLASCQTKGRTGAASGAAVGAVAGQLIGGDTGATLLGAAVGAGAGYAVGNEMDKSDAKEREAQNEAEMRRMKQEQAQGTAGEAGTTARPSPLTGTRWKVASLVAAEPHEYASKLVDFTADTVTCTTTTKDGTVTTDVDKYTVVGDAIVVRGKNGVINAQFALDGDQLIINCNEFRAVLERL